MYDPLSPPELLPPALDAEDGRTDHAGETVTEMFSKISSVQASRTSERSSDGAATRQTPLRPPTKGEADGKAKR